MSRAMMCLVSSIALLAAACLESSESPATDDVESALVDDRLLDEVVAQPGPIAQPEPIAQPGPVPQPAPLPNCPGVPAGTYTSCNLINCPVPLQNQANIGQACSALNPAGSCPGGQAYAGYGSWLVALPNTIACYCGCR